MGAKAMDFFLPGELNASCPPEKRGIRRDHVRMMVLDRSTGKVSHDYFFQLANYLNPGDLVILNSSRTIPAVLQASCLRNGDQIGVRTEVRLARRRHDDKWDALIVASLINIGDTLYFSSELSAKVIGKKKGSPLKIIQFNKKGTELFNFLYALGEPVRYEYIDQPWDLDCYQTVFASSPGSVEMPSAGRAFSWELIFSLRSKGIDFEFIQLHTGLSYFLNDLYMTPEENDEEYHIPEQTMKKILEVKAAGNKVIAAGTTVVRALETAAGNKMLSGMTNLYIHSLYPLKIADGILTGFHEPQASHLDMLSAFVSEQHLLTAYQQAISAGYLWHEFGDMNLII